MDLHQASKQWASRPDDERFSNLNEMYKATLEYFMERRTSESPYRDLSVIAGEDDELYLTGKMGVKAKFTNWSFGQLASKLECPTGYLQRLPATLTAQNLNYGLANKSDLTDANLLLKQTGDIDLSVRSITSNRYARIWDFEIISKLKENLEFSPGWVVPPARPAHANQKGTRPATQEDLLAYGKFGLSINLGDMIAPAGLYGSDHDCFLFFVNEQNRINDGNNAVSKGFFLSNSEVGAATFKLMKFYYKSVCGNHIVWDATM